MTYFRALSVLAVILLFTSGASAQYGLYGSPELLPFAPAAPAVADQHPYPSMPPAAPPYRAAAPGDPYGLMRTRAGEPLPPAPTIPGQPAPAQPRPGQPGLVGEVLGEANGYQPGCYGLAEPPASCSPSWTDCVPCYQPKWFASVAALGMGRDRANRLWTTYETGNEPNQIPTDADVSWAVGWEVRLGRSFSCGRYTLEGVYWGLDAVDGYSVAAMPGGTVSTPLDVSRIEFAGTNGTFYFDNAAEHRVRRRNEAHNVEINLFRNFSQGYGGAVRLGCSAGVRYFRFEEDYTFGSLAGGYTWGQDGGQWEAYMHDNVKNNLVGFQMTGNLDYQMWGGLWCFVRPKIGIYNNRIQHRFDLYRGDGVIGNPTAISGVTGTYPVAGSEDVLSFMSEVDLGLDWQVSPCCSLFLGYRVLFATGIALADHQIPHYVVDIPEIADVDSNGQLVLHGAFTGVEVRF